MSSANTSACLDDFIPTPKLPLNLSLPTEAEEIYVRFGKQSAKGLGPNILVAYFDNEVVDLIRANAIEPLNDYEIDWSVFRSGSL